MNKELFKHNKSVVLFSATITCLLMYYLVHTRKIILLYETTHKILEPLFKLASYYLLIAIGDKLEKKEIHGVSTIAISLFCFSLVSFTKNLEIGIYERIVNIISLILNIFQITRGLLLIGLSIFYHLRNIEKKDKELIEIIETFLATVVSLVSIVMFFI